MLRNNHANFCTNPLTSETNDGPASTIEQLSVPDNGPAISTSSFLQLPNDSPAKHPPVPNDGLTSTIKQLSVPHNGPAHFKQLSVPMTTASPGLQADNDCHSSLNDVTAPQAFPATTATMTVTMTQVPTMTTAITKATIKLVKCFLHSAKSAANHATPRNLLLFFVQNDSAIMIPSLLLHVQNGSAIMTVLIAQNLLLFFVQNNPANQTLKLIVKYSKNIPSLP
jgi:hypothetical protein